MRVLLCLGVVLAASAAQAQTYTTTFSPDKQTSTTVGGGYTVTRQTSKDAYGSTTVTITRTPTGGYRPLGAGGYKPLGH